MTRLALLALLLAGPTCERSAAVLIVEGCDTADLIIESGGPDGLIEIARVPAGVSGVCRWVPESRLATLYSRCEGDGESIEVLRGVFAPAEECV